jgi:pimeloyl-ACP methyl ester carboxylesterase
MSAKSGCRLAISATLLIFFLCPPRLARPAREDGVLLFPDYLPLRAGAISVYQFSASDGTQFTYETRVEQPTASGTTLIYPVRDIASVGIAVEVHYLSSDGVFGFQEHAFEWLDWPSCGFRYSPPRRVPSGLLPGQVFSQQVSVIPTGEPCGSGTDLITTTFVGFETVTVPAGTFENCAIVTMANKGDFDYTTTFYLARNVGAVKIVDSGEGETTISELMYAEVPKILISNARMVSSHELGVDLVATVPKSDPPGGPWKVRFSAEINGKPVSTREYDITDQLLPGCSNWPVPFDQGSDPRRIDLKAHDVPRFQDHQKFDLHATLITPRSSATAVKEVEIPLPVVVIHGVLVELYEEIFWPVKYTRLKNYLLENGFDDSDAHYRTYRYLDFSSQNDTAVEVGAKLLGMAQQYVATTYADKINIIGHSMGGLIGRYFSHIYPDYVCKVVTLGSPHSGSTYFYIRAFRDFLIRREVTDLLSTSDHLPNLRNWLPPVHESLYFWPNDLKLPEQFIFPNLFSQSPYSGPVPQSVAYYSLYNYLKETPYEIRVLPSVIDPGWYHYVNTKSTVPGDGVVSRKSAVGDGTRPVPVPTRVEHADLAEDPLVDAEILRCLKEVKSTTATAYRIADLGAVEASTGGYADAVTAGYARIEPSAQMTAPSGMAIYSFRQNDVVASEATMPATPLMTSGRIYAEITSTTNTGLAIVNPSTAAALISYYFTSDTGLESLRGTFPIPGGGQIAQFLDQAPFSAAAPFGGTFTFTSSTPVVAIALRGLINERHDFLMTTLPVSELKTPGQDVTVFPHFADGGGWSTKILLVNPTDEAMSGTISFFDQGTATTAGKLVGVIIEGQTSSSFGYSIPPRSSKRFQTAGMAASVQAGSAYIRPAWNSRTPDGLGVFTYKNAGVTVTEAGVRALPPAQAFRLYAEYSGEMNTGDTGFALANPSASPVTVSLTLSDLEGNSTGLAGTVTIPSNGQVATFIQQVGGFEKIQAPFKGVLRISTTSSPSGIVAVALRGRTNERGDYIVTTAVPVDESRSPVAAQFFFPHLADGGGYVTEFVLFSGSAGQATSGILRFFTQAGEPLTLSIK